MPEQPSPGASLAPALLTDFRLLMILFIMFRLGLAIVYQPALFERYTAAGEPERIERGMSVFGDFHYQYELAALTDQGDWFYRDVWFEFPPLWGVLFVGLYRVMALLGPVAYSPWATLIGLLLTLVDIGNLLLLRQLGALLHAEETGIALSWIYALLLVPVVMTWWNFEPLVLLLLLLALWWLLTGQRTRSALAVAGGMLTKYVAVLVLPAVWRFRPARFAWRYTALSLALPVIVLGALVAWGGETARVSLTVQASKPSYQTVWALIDGNYNTGQFPPAAQHRDLDTATIDTGNSPVVPGWLRLVPFAALGGWVYWRTTRRDDRALVAFVTLTIVLFFLWAQGWSPQWVLTLTPLILLNFPDRVGVLVCVLLGFMSFLEYPTLFSRTMASGGSISGEMRPVFVALVILRTVLLAGIALVLVQRLVGEVASEDA